MQQSLARNLSCTLKKKLGLLLKFIEQPAELQCPAFNLKNPNKQETSDVSPSTHCTQEIISQKPTTTATIGLTDKQNDDKIDQDDDNDDNDNDDGS